MASNLRVQVAIKAATRLAGKSADITIVDDAEALPSRSHPEPGMWIRRLDINTFETGMDAPPTSLSIDPNHKCYHPSYARVGLEIDGVRRNDVREYNAITGEYFVQRSTLRHRARVGIIAYWRYLESRQQRRKREAWERKHQRG